MALALGIDLGTTNSVASVYRRGARETVPIDGRPALPSVVSFREDGTVLVGQAAKASKLIRPESTVSSTKRDMGDRTKRYRIAGRTFSPVDIAGLILRRIVDEARKSLGEDVWDTVITVPAYFTEDQREDTRRAGEEAGLNVLRLIPEPTAAAIAYALDKQKDQTILVYDLGGGTFDVSLLEVKGNNFHVKAVGGDSRLGGDDFDESLMRWANDKFRAQTGEDILSNTSREGRFAQQRLKEACEAVKIELSDTDYAHLTIPDCLGRPLDLEMKRSQFEDLTLPLLRRTVDCMRAVLKDADVTVDDIDRVILVGGSTRIPAVREIVAQAIKEPYIADRVDEVVAHGAGVVAANLYLPEEDGTPIPLEISEVTGHSLGVEMLDEQQQEFVVPIIPRQTPYPCRRGVLGFTLRPEQETVELRVYRGEAHRPNGNRYLGELVLPISPPQPVQVPIAAIFELDANGIIHFTAVRLASKPSTQAIIEFAKNNQNALDVKAVDQMIADGEVQPRTVRIQT